jgi:hypothetical protein
MSQSSNKIEFVFTSSGDVASQPKAGKGKTNEQKQQEAEARRAVKETERIKRRDEARAYREKTKAERLASTEESVMRRQKFNIDTALAARLAARKSWQDQQAQLKADRDAAKTEAAKRAAIDRALSGIAGKVQAGGILNSFRILQGAGGGPPKAPTGQSGANTGIPGSVPMPTASSPFAPIPSAGGKGMPVPPQVARVGGKIVNLSQVTQMGGAPPNLPPKAPGLMPAGSGGGGSKGLGLGNISTQALARIFFILEIAKVVGQVFVALGKIVGQIVNKMYEVYKSQQELAKTLSNYNGVIASSLANQRVALVNARINQGNSLQSEMSGFVREDTRLQTNMIQIQTEIQKALLPLATEGLEVLNAMAPLVIEAIQLWKAAGGDQMTSAIGTATDVLKIDLAALRGALHGIGAGLDWIVGNQKDEKNAANLNDIYKDLATFMGSNTSQFDQANGKRIKSLPTLVMGP